MEQLHNHSTKREPRMTAADKGMRNDPLLPAEKLPLPGSPKAPESKKNTPHPGDHLTATYWG